MTAVTYSITAKQDDTPVRGNAIASGDARFDRATEDAILARLERGDVWAWAEVQVTASITVDGTVFTGIDRLFGCTYLDENDFSARNDYFPDMKAAALADLRERLKDAVRLAACALHGLAELSAV
jgi:hypothetical protein